MANSQEPEYLKADDVDEGAPLWMVSFADMSLLLLCFFIFFVAVSHQGVELTQDLLRQLVLHKPESAPEGQSIPQVVSERPGRRKTQIRWQSPAIEGVNRPVAELNIRQKHPLGRPVLFAEGSHEIEGSEWRTRLEEIAEIVRHHFREIVIQGHCSLAEANEFDGETRGHNLSYLRALAVQRELVKLGVNASSMRLVSCASHDCKYEPDETLQRRAVITLGDYFLPGSRAAAAMDRSPGD